MKQTKAKAVALISGGLDSMLAAKAIMDQGIEVEGINFYTGFCHSGHTSAIRNSKKAKPKRNDALWVAEQLGIKLHIIDIVEEYKQIVINPRYDYGKHINPCLDCKIFMVKKALQWQHENGFDFIITGEVVGQRPKSQKKTAMPIVAKRSGAEDRLVRPLCGKLLPPTWPELEGLIDREQLFDFSGRSRKPQLALAEQYGFIDFAQPSGGCCVLTDESFARKLQDWWQVRGEKNYELEDVILLKVGRHIRPKPHFKLIIARDESENNFIKGYTRNYCWLQAADGVGPIALIEGELEPGDLHLAAQITARFSRKTESGSSKAIHVTYPDSHRQLLMVTPYNADDIAKEWYV